MDTIERILTAGATWAVVGCSPDPSRPSNDVARFLQRNGYEVVPVNPTCGASILGVRCYPDLESAARDHDIDVVDVFRRSSQAGVHVDQAIAIGAKAVWLQLGVIDEAAAGRARAAGLDVVMDRCPAIELPRLSAGAKGLSARGPRRAWRTRP